MESLLARVPELGIGESQVTLDMGMARGISYYTGVIFELAQDDDDASALGGGGRYDDLVQALGGRERVPAMGFAYNVSSLLDTLQTDDGVSVNGV